MNILDNTTYFLYLVTLAGLLHACLQLPLANQLQLGTHILGRGRPRQAAWASIAVACGAVISVGAILLGAAGLISLFADTNMRLFTAGITLICSGVFIMFYYYRSSAGAQSWLPEKIRERMQRRIKRTDSWPSAIYVGLKATAYESPLSLPLALFAVSLLLQVGFQDIFLGLILYMTCSVLPLIVVAIAHNFHLPLGRLVKWRIDSKRFWQFFVGLSFIALGLYAASSDYLRTGL